MDELFLGFESAGKSWMLGEKGGTVHFRSDIHPLGEFSEGLSTILLNLIPKFFFTIRDAYNLLQ